MGLVLAGGRSVRFGGEKAVALLDGRPLVQWAAERLRSVCARVAIASSVTDAMRLVIFDPQTSGGLLVAVEPSATAHVIGRLHDAGVPARVIGRVEASDAGGVLVRVE